MAEHEHVPACGPCVWLVIKPVSLCQRFFFPSLNSYQTIGNRLVRGGTLCPLPVLHATTVSEFISTLVLLCLGDTVSLEPSTPPGFHSLSLSCTLSPDRNIPVGAECSKFSHRVRSFYVRLFSLVFSFLAPKSKG